MGERCVCQASLFYKFSLEQHVPADHLLRSIDRFVDLESAGVQLAPFYSSAGRPSIDPELMVRMLIVGYCYGIRSERRLCEEVHLNLAYRWFCRLGLEDEVPDHSTFSKNRHVRFRDSGLFRHVFETVARRCMAEGLVGGDGFAVDASLIRADANRQHGVDGLQGLSPEISSRSVEEYLDVLDDAAFGSATELTPKFISPADPAGRWTGAHGGQAFFAYSDNYLIDLDNAVIVDVEASTAIRQAEVVASKMMIERVQERLGLYPERLAADTAYGSAEMLGWLVHERGIEPHIPVFDKSHRDDGTFPRDDFTCDHKGDVYFCPGGKMLTCKGTVVNDNQLMYRASNMTATPALSSHAAVPKSQHAKFHARSMKAPGIWPAISLRLMPIAPRGGSERKSRCYSLISNASSVSTGSNYEDLAAQTVSNGGLSDKAHPTSLEGTDRGQLTLLPEYLDDWIDENDPVRVIEAFVETLHLAELGFDGVEPETTGRPSYHPSVLLKLYIYGYLNRVQSSRRLEREAGRNFEVMWLLRRLVPDHKTIADFRKDNGTGLRNVCARFVELCREMRLLTNASVAIDGSKFKAVNNRDKNFTRAKVERRRAQLAESVARYLSQLDTADRQEPSELLAAKTSHLKEKLAKLEEEMKRLNEREVQMIAAPDEQISLTDPDSRSMATSGRGSGVVGYNVQVAVDTEHHLIVTHEVTNIGNDRAQLARVAKAAKATLQTGSLEAVADRGYFSSEEILACQEAGITVTMPKPVTSGIQAKGKFGKQDFRYTTGEDVYICPAGEKLTYHYTNEENGLVLRRYWTSTCRSCAIKHKCTTGKERRITRWEHEHLIEAVQKRLDENPKAMRIRRETVEHPFGTIKARMGATHFLMKTLPRVASEMALHVLAYNLTRAMNIIGVRPLLAAIGE